MTEPTKEYVTQWSDDGGVTWHTAGPATKNDNGWTVTGLPADCVVARIRIVPR